MRRSQRMRLGLCASLCVVAACRSRSAEPAFDAALEARSAAIVVAVDATAAPAPSPWVDLLHAAPAEVAVSSTVQNPRDKPMHLVDGSLATAWNSKTCGYVKAVLACSELSPAYAPPLALKTPTRAGMTAADMTALPWRGEVTFHAGADGTLHVAPTR